MTKEEAFFNEAESWGVTTDSEYVKRRRIFERGYDAALAAANQWTYLPELPTESAYYCATRQLQSGRTYVWQSYFDLNRSEWTIGLNERVIAWRSLPPPAEIKRSEDEV